ncbi:FtsW/RodA/SpoVE family cell cycle protein [Patescibacteria group bacterium]|jgi:rod shape determining protein RodA|nr:FtsW/RodA/SpoVE family cell cycle protein [Patescibacteria group bacterium]
MRTLAHIDWLLLSAALVLTGAGLVSMHTFSPENGLFWRQCVWLTLALVAFFSLAQVDFRFLRRTAVITGLYLGTLGVLALLLAVGAVFQGAQSWFDLGAFAVQPSDPAKIVLILVLAKYFSRRHVEIANLRHIITSGAYAFLLFVLIFLQPDFGSAIILGSLWLGMVLVAGISLRHLAGVALLGIVAGAGLWFFVFEDFQKERIVSFLNPYTDIQGAGYNAYQATIAVGSGQLWGKGIGYGTQSKLEFLPEYETDFIFAAFAEEWGFVGVLLVLTLFGVLIWRILATAGLGQSNFEVLFGAGVAILFVAHVTIHVGMNVGLLPVTGTTVPFMSYGGSHLLTEFSALGILMGMRRYARAVDREQLAGEVAVEVPEPPAPPEERQSLFVAR